MDRVLTHSPLRAVYDQHRHLDALLRDPALPAQDFDGHLLRVFWAAIVAEVKRQDTERK